MSWLLDRIKSLFDAACGETDCSIHDQDTEETTPNPASDSCPPDEELAGMRMPELRNLAASRDLGDGRYKGVNRANLTE